MKNYLKLVLIVAVFSALFSCKNTLDINAPWKETTVVYGLLDPNAPIQYIKINKAFLGNGNEMAYAKIADSINYGNQLSAVLQQYSNGSLVATFPLHDTLMPKDPGTFATSPNIVFIPPAGFI